MTAIPIIDIARFRASGDPAAVAVLEAAATQSGFFLVTGHGVDPDVTATLYRLSRAFFDLPAETRAALAGPAETMGGLSYAPFTHEALAATRGERTPGDLKHSLNFGARLPGALWPAAPAGLETAFRAYFAQMEQLAAVLRRMFCAAIGLPPDHFEADFTAHLSALRVIDYPAQDVPPLPGQLRAGAHTDYGFMTILRSEAAPGGLEVQTRSGDWVAVPNVEGAFVINIGDAFMRWSNDTWVSTPHRVVNPPDGASQSRRQSIPFFVNPNRETIIECLPPFRGAGSRFAPISFEDYIALKTQQAFAKHRADGCDSTNFRQR